jgi:hypothetical protein
MPNVNVFRGSDASLVWPSRSNRTKNNVKPESTSELGLRCLTSRFNQSKKQSN